MKKLIAVVIAVGTLLSGCVAYAPAPGYRDPGYHNNWGARDRDRDGVPNRYDRAPRDPRFY